MTTMSSKYAGRCLCGQPFKRGAMIEYDRGARQVTGCSACGKLGREIGPKAEPDMAQAFDMVYEDQCRDACGL